MVEIHLYGKLRRLVPNSRAAEDTVIRLEPEEDETIQSMLRRAGVPIEELYHIFLNGNFCSPKKNMPITIGPVIPCI